MTAGVTSQSHEGLSVRSPYGPRLPGAPWQDFVAESMAHGWPSFRDEEVVWENVIVLPGGEAAAVDEPCPRPNPDRDPGLQAERETESGFENRAQVRPSR